jgi:Alpha galactosidase C-terminal beta sandwich domain
MSWHVVGIFNMSEDEMCESINFAELELSNEIGYHVYDFWNRRYLGFHKKGIFIDSIPSHGCRLLGIRPEPDEMLAARVEEKACLLSSLMHYTQGGIELRNISYNFYSRIIEVSLKKIPGGKGDLVFFFGGDLNDCEIRSSLRPGSFQKIDNHVIMIQVSYCEPDTQEWTIWRTTYGAIEEEFFYKICAKVCD